MNGHELLETIASLPPSGRSAVIMRHAARYPILDSTNPTLAEITPEGAAAAEAMGRRITGFDRLRLFHSPIKRCRQTAECVADGARAAGLVVENVGAEAALGVDYILNLGDAGRLSDQHGENFVRLWMEGKMAPPVICPTVVVAEAKLAYLTAKMNEPEAEGRRLDVHVSHDWNVMVLRELMLGVRHEEAGWITFLDGVGFSLADGRLSAQYRAHTRTQPLPWRFGSST